ncbi:Beta-hexosaminidase [Streptomyces fumanus]
MTTLTQGTDTLTRNALTVLQPGFTGTTAPDWLLRRLGEGLAAVALFGRNVASAEQVAALTAKLRAERDDVLVAIDEEGGDVTRLEVRTGSSFPGNHALGAVDDVELTRGVAAELGRRLAACGVNLDWAPSADVNANPDNPVIGVRSFGADPALVARHTAAYVTGLQSAGVAACTKHFPGHGDTAVDSHHAVPRIDADATVLAERDLVPFRAAIEAGTRAVMSAHILAPALDPDHPGTLSRRILIELLRGELGYDGLIVTDGIEMRAIAGTYGIEHGARPRLPARGRQSRPPAPYGSAPPVASARPPRDPPAGVRAQARGPRRPPPPGRAPRRAPRRRRPGPAARRAVQRRGGVVGVDDPGRRRLHRDAPGPQHLGQVAGEDVQRALGHRVGDVVRHQGGRARPEEMLMIRPPSRSRRMPCWTRKKGAFTFTAKTWSYSSSVISLIGRALPIPALFTRMSSPSACRLNSAHSASASPGRPSSAPMANAEPPASSMAATVSFAAASLLP